jgi:ubiquinone/menaquinone biosynthesis C-methylase UbiE
MTQAPDPREHGRRVAAVFDLAAPGYDSPALRFFPFAADRLVHKLNPGPGDKLLDVAAGTGAVTLAAAQAVVPGGRITAIDLAEQMLARLEEKIRKFGIGHVDIHVMDAAQLEFRREYFHHVACSFGLFFLPDLAAALREWARVLRAGGRLALTSFAPGAFEPLKALFLARMQGLGVVTETPVAAASRRLADREQCRLLLERAGFTDIGIATEQLGFHLRNTRDWWEILWGSGYRGLLASLAPAQLEAFRDAHLAEVGALAGDQGIWLDLPVNFILARKP